MASLTMEHWLVLGGVAAFGILGALYGVSRLLERELLKIRLRLHARAVLDAHERRLEAIARGDILPSADGADLTLPLPGL